MQLNCDENRLKLVFVCRFNDMRKWVIQNLDKEPSHLFRTIYEILYSSLDSKSIPQSILIHQSFFKDNYETIPQLNLIHQ